MTEHGITSPKSQELVNFAYEYAKEAHGDQKRKYTGEPYINHPVAVAKIVMGVPHNIDMLCAALLHDVIEDTERTYEDIRDVGFMFPIADMVVELSDVSKPEDGNRAFRKQLDREHLATISNHAKTVKLADLINNSESITRHDAGFAKVYMKEKKLLLPLLEGGDHKLMEIATKIVDDYYAE